MQKWFKNVVFFAIISCGVFKMNASSHLYIKPPNSIVGTSIKAGLELMECGKIGTTSFASYALYGTAQGIVSGFLSPHFFTKGLMGHATDTMSNEGVYGVFRTLLHTYPTPCVQAPIWTLLGTSHINVLAALSFVALSRFGSWPQLESSDVAHILKKAACIVGSSSAVIGALTYKNCVPLSQHLVGWYSKKGIPVSDIRMYVSCDAALNVAYIGGVLTIYGAGSYILLKRYMKKYEMTLRS